MRKILWKKLTRGGFTLAELLIVVAIIAILVAIAVPIFSGALDDSREAVHRSNARALKVMAVQELLTNNDLEELLISGSCWKVSAKYDFSSEKFTSITITSADSVAAFAVNGFSGKDVGNQSTTKTADYTVYFNQQDVSATKG